MVWRSLKRAARRRRERAGVLERAYRSVFLCPDGEIVLADLAAECGIYQAPPVNLEPRAGGYLTTRRFELIHPAGMDFTASSLAKSQGASLAELRNAANWDRKYNRKNVKLACLKVNI